MERRDVLKLGASAAAVLAASPLLAAIPPLSSEEKRSLTSLTMVGDRISVPGVPNKNGRIYPRDVWERAIAQEQTRLAARHMLVHSWTAPGISPRGWENSLQSVVGVVTGIILGAEVWATWEPLQTPEALRWGEIITQGLYDMRASGRGSVRAGVVQDDFVLERLVIMPAGMGA